MTTSLDERLGKEPKLGRTARTLKRNLTDLFRDAGMLFPEEDAFELIMAATGRDRTDIILNGQELLEAEHIEAIMNYASRRLAGEPVDSILGWREFFGRQFVISKAVLSPRADTENLIRCGLKALEGKASPICLDLGTGSGAILVTLLAERPDASGVGVDISDDALGIARKNAIELGVSDRTEFLRSAWFDSVRGKFDLIISNPPYITDEAMKGLEAEVVHYDPDISLRGGADGLNAYREILSQASTYLKPGGSLWVEIGYDQSASVQSLFEKNKFSDIQVLKDLSGQSRCVGGKSSG